MFILRLDKSLRVACGVGLLGLLVVQEKLWPWLLAVPEARQPAAAASPPTDGGSESKPNPRLPYILPDTPLSRWPAGCFDQTLRRAAGDRDGVVSCGQQDPKSRDTTSFTAADFSLAWHRFQCPSGPSGAAIDGPAQPAVVSPAVETCISPTGPPSTA